MSSKNTLPIIYAVVAVITLVVAIVSFAAGVPVAGILFGAIGLVFARLWWIKRPAAVAKRRAVETPRVEGTLAQPLDEAMTATRRVAGENGYALDEARSGPNQLVFKKGASLVSWGSEFTVRFEAVGSSETRLAIGTDETYAVTDWGRGKRATHQLLDELGATYT